MDVVCSVGGGLDPPVRQGDDEGALDSAILVLDLGLCEVSLTVVILDPVLVLVGKVAGWTLC